MLRVNQRRKETGNHLLALILSLLVIGGFGLAASAQEWTRFRGPNGTGIAQGSADIPSAWTEKDFNWRVSLPGEGHSSPVLWGDKIFLTSIEGPGENIIVYALAVEDGGMLWRREFPFIPFRIHQFNQFASGTPAVDGERVYVCWARPDRYFFTALDHEGNTVWERDLGPYKSQHGGGASPIVYGDKVILANDQRGESFLLALDSRTGETRWKTARRSAAAAYSTPCVYESEAGPLLIFNSEAHGISAVNPEDGAVVWEIDTVFDKRSVSSPVAAGGLIFGSCGSGGGGNYLVAVRPGNPESGREPELAYELRQSAPYVPTGVPLDDLLFLWSDGGIVSCLHAPSGTVRWRERVGGNYFGSPIRVDNRIFCVSSEGEVVVIQADGNELKVLARNSLGEKSHSTPAVAGGRMYIRTLTQLFSVGGRPEI